MRDRPSGENLARRVRSLAREPWSRNHGWLHVVSEAGLALYATVLWTSGYPAWRAAVVAGVLLAWLVLHAVVLVARARAGGEGVQAALDAGEWVMLATWFAAVAVTGGLRSPLLPAAIAVLPLRLFQHGFGPRTQGHLAATALLTAGVAALPAPWAGPPVAQAAYWTIVAVSVLIVAATTVVYLAMLTRVAHDSVREATRAREELTLEALARARELEQLGAQLSHELKNPLSAIKTLVQLAARSVQDAQSRERLEVVEGEIRRMQQILQDYLSFSRPLEKLHLEDVALAGVADDVLALVAGRAAEARVALRRRGDARALADPRRLREALLNLLVNALEASSPGGRIEVELGEHAGAARVVVRDSGRGMPEDVLARIGTPFFTTREEGTGLGVALARATFVHHGGTLEYASRPGDGTTATATLPIPAARRLDGARARGG
jgi:signal transduction histidine kinase